MTYTTFLGIDIGKFNFVVSIYGTKQVAEYENSSAGIAQFIAANKEVLSGALSVLETTGGYELPLIYTLVSADYKVHRADTKKVKNFIRSFGNAVKTDRLDAQALAKYGFERNSQLDLFTLADQSSIDLFQLVQRRNDLKTNLVAEKNRLQSPCSQKIKDYITSMISCISDQIQEITEQINSIIELSPALKKKRDELKTIPGIGNIVAFELLVLLPELGTLSRRKIASLAGLAPRANESGTFSGYRRTGNGRGGVKPILFLAAMAARNSKSQLKEFYEKLINRGKKKMVALTALMRKILVIANAKLKEI